MHTETVTLRRGINATAFSGGTEREPFHITLDEPLFLHAGVHKLIFEKGEGDDWQVTVETLEFRADEEPPRTELPSRKLLPPPQPKVDVPLAADGDDDEAMSEVQAPCDVNTFADDEPMLA